MGRAFQFVGKRFGRLLVAEKAESSRFGASRWRCRCDCGKEKVALGYLLNRGVVRSCGCLADEFNEGRSEHFRRYREGAVRRYKETGRGCWEYTGNIAVDGYATVGRKQERVHRMAYEHANGPIPPGKIVMHRCDNRKCINPSHLRVGTQADNMRDMQRKGRALGNNRGESNAGAKLTEDGVRELRRRYREGGVTQDELAEEYGVNQATIWAALSRRTWKHI